MQLIRQEIQMFQITFAKLIAASLASQTHVPASASGVRVQVHVLEHLEDGVVQGFQPDVH